MWLVLVVVFVVLAAGGAVVAWQLLGSDDGGGTFELAVSEPVDVTGSFALAGDPLGPSISRYVDGGATRGTTAVLTGGVSNGPVIRHTTIVSNDAGRSWRLAEVTDSDGEPGSMDGAETVLASPRGWIAVDGSFPVEIWVSPDGTSWEGLEPMRSPTFEEGDRITGGVVTANGFLLVGYASEPSGDAERAVTWTSTDGRDWERHELDELAWSDAYDPVLASHGSDILVSASQYDDGAWVSHDGGVTWKPLDTPWEGGMVTATPAGFAFAEDVLDYPREGYLVYESADGEQWGPPTEVLSSWNGAVDGLYSLPSGLVMITSQYDGSVDLYAGDARQLRPAGQVSGVDTIATALRTDQGLILATGTNYSSSEGEDARLYTYSPGGPPQQHSFPSAPELTLPVAGIYDVASGDGVTMAVGGNDGRPAVWIRSDGGWQAVAEPEAPEQWQWFEAVEYGPAGFVVSAANSQSDSALLRSDDGSAWQPVTVPELTKSEYDYFGFETVTADDSGYLVTAYVFSESGSTKKLLTSSDLESWEVAERSSDSESLSIYDAAVEGSRRAVLAVDWGADGVASVWLDEGGQWEATEIPVPDDVDDTSYTRLAMSGETLVAVGTAYPSGSDGDQATVPVAATSSDGGRTWSDSQVLDHDGDLASADALVATSRGFVAFGSDDETAVAWTSSDGTDFERQELGDTARDDALYGYVIGVGETGDDLVVLTYGLSLAALDVHELVATLP